ncbi:MAG: Cell cycle serine/threonine-protein kinase cdc5/MSD2 [Sclerophora amabilis]|nr:MAG: Cell cycle serine/threonine-protein kinase cdc5/MSD2 [Sclerophora amabilis]
MAANSFSGRSETILDGEDPTSQYDEPHNHSRIDKSSGSAGPADAREKTRDDSQLIGDPTHDEQPGDTFTYESVSKTVLESEIEIFFGKLLPDLAEGGKVSKMEPLSPRPTNVPNRLLKSTGKIVKGSKPATTSSAKQNRDRNHPADPPQHIQEPDWPNGQPGQRYAIKNLLGQGGFAICYEAETEDRNDEPSGSSFAIKIVKRVHPLPKMMDKFKSELQIHSKMQHPNIVEFHRAFTYGESTHVVLGLCPNGSLMEMVRRRKFLTEPEVRRYVIQISGAIKYMHHRNVIHRDLKMGNIFLDKDMNVKIGDFGLAALLVSDAELSHTRRTTMCGTPNYIAPEVLEKSKRGHDYKVDIWSLGVIIFAMLTGYPPFQAKSTDEIYKKVKARDYDWPVSEKCANKISQSAKDLVRDLLVGADDRPEPDDIVSHQFLRSGIVMGPIPSSSRYNAPPFSYKGIVDANSEQDWWDSQWNALCKQCGVGRKAPDKTWPVVGGNINTTIYRECQIEENEGRTPIVPLPEKLVYLPFLRRKQQPAAKDGTDNVLKVPQGKSSMQASSSQIAIPQVPDVFLRRSEEKARSVKTQQKTAAALGKAKSTGDQARQEEYPSSAAGIRKVDSAPISVASTRSSAALSDSGALSSKSGPPSIAASSVNSRKALLAASKIDDVDQVKPQAGLLSEGPVRPLSSSSAMTSKHGQSGTARLTRSRTVQAKLGRETAESVGGPDLSKPSSSNALLKNSRAKLSNTLKRGTEKVTNEQRLASQVEELIRDKNETQRGPLPVRSRSNISDRSPKTMLIDPAEVAESLPCTRSTEINKQLEKLVEQLKLALEEKHPTVSLTNRKRKSPPIVVKWVDYTNKFGIGYILSDGSVGCLFNAEAMMPSTSIVVRGGERHMNNRKLKAYTERHQLIPTSGQAIEFYENLASQGIKRVFVDPKEYEIDLGPGNTPGKLANGTTKFDSAKRKRVILLHKFANYMTGGLGSSPQSSSQLENADEEAPGCDAFVKFYQRLGDVGVWSFGDGSFQFNFPDHTKLVLSRDGKHCDLYHLPEEAARQLGKTGRLTENALDKRSLLSYPTQSLLRGSHGSKSFAAITTANDFRKKISFIQNLFSIWLTNGGIGCTDPDNKIEWQGMRENKGEGKVEKLVWVTVGAHGGDRRTSSSSASSSS